MIYDKKYVKQNIVFLTIAIVCAVFFLSQFWEFYHDDPYIGLTYARNLLEGNGLVWTDGQRVEGFTQFLWIILIAAVGWFNIDLVLASKLLGIFFAFSTLLLFFTGNKKSIPIGGLLLVTNCCFTFWACGGLEPVVCGFFIFLGCTLYLKDNKSRSLFFVNGTIFCFAALTRLEGLLFFGMTFLFILLCGSLPFKRRFKNTVFFVLGFLVVFLPYFIWRFVYFGHLFPCPFYAKGGTNIFKMLFGARYLLHFLATFGFPLVLILFVKNFRNFITKHIYLILLISAYSFYVFVIGGDHMPGYRFFVPILPLFYLFVQECFYAFRFKWTLAPTIAVAMLLVAVNFYVSFSMIPRGPEATIVAVKYHLQYRVCQTVPDAAAYFGKHVGLYIKDHWPKDSIVAVNAAGAGPYYSRMNCIDMLGLNNYTIAQRKITFDTEFLFKDKKNLLKLLSSEGRSELTKQIRSKYSFWQLMPGHGKGDGKYVLSEKPDYIILGGSEGDSKPWFIGDQEIFESLDFKNNYELKIERIQINDDFHKFYKPSKTGILEFKYYMRKQQ
jgi:hypothetical protein